MPITMREVGSAWNLNTHKNAYNDIGQGEREGKPTNCKENYGGKRCNYPVNENDDELTEPRGCNINGAPPKGG